MKPVLKPGRNCQGFYETRETGLLIDGRDYYRAFHQAARQARRSILLAGWQFDSRVALLRGREAKEAEGEVALLPFLRSLCERNPALEVWILAWDFSLLFSLEREWFQERVFNEWSQNPRLRFRFDSAHAVGASHHQKFAVIDGWAGFVGGMDICAARWDDRRHETHNPLRVDSEGKAYGPYHDVHSYHIGPAAQALADLFARRWAKASGEELYLPPPEPRDFRIRPSVPLETDHVALSRTAARTLVPLQDSVQEIRNLYVDAISSAEEIIYMENQYFTSRAVYQALLERMQVKGNRPLEIILFLPREPNALIEEIALTTAQARVLRSLKEAARKQGHHFGVYFPACRDKGKTVATYIHSKLLLVDDRFLTVGSANATNRSMGLDTELNVSWEGDPGKEPDLIRSLRRARLSLLREHAGLHRWEGRRRLTRPGGLVKFMDTTAERESSRLHFYHPTESSVFLEWLNGLAEELPIDSDKPFLEENLIETISSNPSGLFATGIGFLNRMISSRGEDRARDGAPAPAEEGNRSRPKIRLAIRRILAGIPRGVLYPALIGLLLVLFLVLLWVFLPAD